MPALVAGIHAFLLRRQEASFAGQRAKAWMLGTSPSMTYLFEKEQK
jgi:hypothetical protein